MAGKPIVFKAVGYYVQGPGLLDRLGEYITEYAGGARVCLLLDEGVRFLLSRIESSLISHGINYFVQNFDGNLFRGYVESLAEHIRKRQSVDLVLGVGSGKAIDMSKMLAHIIGAKNIVVATASSTDAPPSHSAVVVDERGHVSAESLPSSPDMVIVDSEVIASAPVRLFVAGIGDAVSKKYEMETARKLGEDNFVGGRPAYFVEAMAETLHQCLIEKGAAAKASVERKKCSEEVEQVITACVLLSTLIWENGGLAGAHGIANVLVNSGCCRQTLHGEHVAFGLLVQLLLQGRLEDLVTMERYYQELGLPRVIADLGLKGEDKIREIGEAIHQRWEKHHLDFTAEEIAKAIRDLDNRRTSL
jgi:glycerol dehydrogenase